jgi:hypothetical protein
VTVLGITTARAKARTERTERRIPAVRPMLTAAVAKLAGRVVVAKAKLRRPVLTVGGLGCVDAAFFQHGWFAGLISTGVSLFVFEMLGGDE